MGIVNTYLDEIGMSEIICMSDREQRRADVVAEIMARTGIDEPMIARVVHGFYAKVRQDPLLGPVFDARVKNWDTHLEKMCQFWSSVALMSGRYHGSPMIKHLPLPVDAAHFDRWLDLFRQTVRELCPPAAQTHFIERAERIAESLELGIATHNRVMLKVGERFHRERQGEKP
jgi:hemoglobin